MEAIYDPAGDVVAWLDPPDFVLGLDGAVIGWLNHGAVIDLTGRQVGSFSHGHFRDPDGAVVGWMKGATGPSPTKPIRTIKPSKPVRHVRPGRPTRHGRVVTAAPVPVWSYLSIDEYLPRENDV
jgi:hypothetical protein